MLSPVYAHDATTPLGAELSRAKASRPAYLRTGSPLHLSWARFQNQSATLSSGKNHYQQGEGCKSEGDKIGGEGQSWGEEITSSLAEPLLPSSK